MRLLRAIVVAALLAGGGVALHHGLVDIPSWCVGLDPNGWMYWFLGCPSPAAGGGGSGAG